MDELYYRQIVQIQRKANRTRRRVMRSRNEMMPPADAGPVERPVRHHWWSTT
jgi:hypothetical protein